MINSVFGTSMALISALSWAGCAVLFKKWGKNYNPININLFNTILSSLWLSAIVILTRSNIIISKESAIIIAISGVLGIVVADSIYYSALRLLSPISLTILSLLGSFFSGFWGYWLFGEIPNQISIIGMILLLVGVGIIYSTYPKYNTLLKFKYYGLFLALISSLLTTFSIAIIKPVLIQNAPITVTMYRMIFSSIVLMLFTIYQKRIVILKNTFTEENKFKSQIVGTSALYAIGGLLCSMLAVQKCNLVIVSSIMTIQPFFVLLIMILFYKHVPKINELISIIFITIGLLLFYIS